MGDRQTARLRPARRTRALPGALLAMFLVSLIGAPHARTASSLDLVATYDVHANLDLGRGSIRVTSRADIVNTSGGPIERVELNTVAAALGDMRLLAAQVDGRPVAADVTGQTIGVPLGRSVAPGERVGVLIAYRAWFRATTGGHSWLWSQANGIVSAYRWIPWVSRRVPFRRDNHGDPFVTPVSPLVRATITSDRPVRFATSGRRVAKDGLSQTFEARRVRDFNFTASASYRVLAGSSSDGETAIRVFTRAGDASRMLGWARRAMARYESLVGPYVYPTLTIGQSSGGYAMESPAHIWLPYGTAPSSIPYLVAHELAHQWFYAAVGSDQATRPFADEAPADLLARTLLGSLRASRCSTSTLDRTIQEYSAACYYEIVYIQGANFLDAMRRRMGSQRFWAALRGYVRDNRYELSDTRGLLEALRAAATHDPLPAYRERFPRLY